MPPITTTVAPPDTEQRRAATERFINASDMRHEQMFRRQTADAWNASGITASQMDAFERFVDRSEGVTDQHERMAALTRLIQHRPDVDPTLLTPAARYIDRATASEGHGVRMAHLFAQVEGHPEIGMEGFARAMEQTLGAGFGQETRARLESALDETACRTLQLTQKAPVWARGREPRGALELLAVVDHDPAVVTSQRARTAASGRLSLLDHMRGAQRETLYTQFPDLHDEVEARVAGQFESWVPKAIFAAVAGFALAPALAAGCGVALGCGPMAVARLLGIGVLVGSSVAVAAPFVVSHLQQHRREAATEREMRASLEQPRQYWTVRAAELDRLAADIRNNVTQMVWNAASATSPPPPPVIDTRDGSSVDIGGIRVDRRTPVAVPVHGQSAGAWTDAQSAVPPSWPRRVLQWLRRCGGWRTHTPAEPTALGATC